jgi:hypothetical protein
MRKSTYLTVVLVIFFLLCTTKTLVYSDPQDNENISILEGIWKMERKIGGTTHRRLFSFRGDQYIFLYLSSGGAYWKAEKGFFSIENNNLIFTARFTTTSFPENATKEVRNNQALENYMNGPQWEALSNDGMFSKEGHRFSLNENTLDLNMYGIWEDGKTARYTLTRVQDGITGVYISGEEDQHLYVKITFKNDGTGVFYLKVRDGVNETRSFKYYEKFLLMNDSIRPYFYDLVDNGIGLNCYIYSGIPHYFNKIE